MKIINFMSKLKNKGFPVTITPNSSSRLALLSVILILCFTQPLFAENALQSISHQRLAGDQIQITFEFSESAPSPQAFTIANPARISLDFANVKNNLAQRSHRINIGQTNSVSTAESSDRTRAVVNLSALLSYDTRVEGNRLILVLSPSGSTAAPVPVAAADSSYQNFDNASAVSYDNGPARITNVDFRRGSNGAGRVLLTLSDPDTPITINQQGSRIIVDLIQASVSSDLQRRYDVRDFGSPVDSVSVTSSSKGVKVSVESSGEFTHLAYQTDNLYTIEVKPQTAQEAQLRRQKEKTFEGEKLSLNFQDIEVRSVLQLIADFTGLNVVVSDSVGGSVTLRLKDVPWDQALDIILDSKGLGQRQKGNVLYIAPATEIAAREQAELAAAEQLIELAPLRTEMFTLNYADAGEMATLLQAEGSSRGEDSNSIVSARGSVTIDGRTNTLLVQDTDDRLEEIRGLINTLDRPVRQVLIEARIVNASDDFTKEFGINFGVRNTDTSADETITSNFDVNLPAINVAGTIGLAIAEIPLGTALDLELSAAQIESNAEIVASPRIYTSNKHTASIEQGVEIPFLEASSSGAATVSFKKAVLSLEVTPQITRDDRINMDLSVKRDTVGQVFAGIPSIDTREINTRVHVENGQTIVLGGIFEQTLSEASTRIPFLSDIPIIGHAFKSNLKDDTQRELLIFITPKIIEEFSEFN